MQAGAMHGIPFPASRKSPAAVASNALVTCNLQVPLVLQTSAVGTPHGLRLRSFHLDGVPRELIISCHSPDFGQKRHARDGDIPADIYPNSKSSTLAICCDLYQTPLYIPKRRPSPRSSVHLPSLRCLPGIPSFCGSDRQTDGQ